jgi:peptidoglycan/LPS O-acetylase OafA/YrhL
MVIAYHLFIHGFSLGWSGVFLFFVLSGFLITRILAHDKSEPHFFARFYSRRALRVFPIYYLLFASVLSVALIRGWHPLSDWPWFAFYLQNWRLAHTSFSPDFPVVLNHTWTLATEEQFYFLWPLIVFFGSRTVLRFAIVGLILIGFLYRTATILVGQNVYDVLTPFLGSVDFLAWGAGATFLLRGQHPRRLAIGARVAFVALAICVGTMAIAHGLDNFWAPKDYLHDIWTGILFPELLGLLFASLLLVVYTDNGLITRILEWSPIRYLGRVSYGLYLYHWPILVAVQMIAGDRRCPILGDQLIRCLIVISLTVIVAILSFEFIERPLLALRGTVILFKPVRGETAS